MSYLLRGFSAAFDSDLRPGEIDPHPETKPARHQTRCLTRPSWVSFASETELSATFQGGSD